MLNLTNAERISILKYKKIEERKAREKHFLKKQKLNI
jgi:hypothetical protein